MSAQNTSLRGWLTADVTTSPWQARIQRTYFGWRRLSSNPSTMFGLAVLLFTGLVQTVAEPVRQFVTPMFWAKMLMIILVATLTALYATAVRRNAALWDAASSRPWPAKIFAVLSTLLWLAIIVCGRFIGYTWSFYA